MLIINGTEICYMVGAVLSANCQPHFSYYSPFLLIFAQNKQR